VNLPYSNPKRRTREELFFDFYAHLLDWATQLVRHDEAEAEDLVHDLFIQFVRVDRTVESIENVEAYLFTTLRNLYYSRMRRTGRDPINDFSIVDYDSVELGLAAVDRRQLLFVRSNLKQICKYACQRKGTARSASILILRFFFGYYPSEVVKVTQSSRMAVDRSLQVARKEARQALERPNVVQSIDPGKEIPVSFGATRDDSENLFAQLRQAILSASEGECFAKGVLAQRYASKSQSGFTTPELAHLVSCRICLDRANQILGLPLLSERSPEDALDHDSHSDDSTGPTGSASIAPKQAASAKHARQRKRLERRVRQLIEHRPSRLQIAINGEVRASQSVTAEVSELYLKLARPEQPTFIEVLSEQGLCLVYLEVEQPANNSGLDQSQSITLSDDRTLYLSLSFAADVPIIHVVYRDPILAESEAEETQGEVRQSGSTEASELVLFPKAATKETGTYGRIRRFILCRSVWVCSRWNFLTSPKMSPLFASGIVLAVCSIICFSVWMVGPARIAPKALLQRATASEISAEAAPSRVIRQRIRIRAPRQTLERSIYRDSSGRRRARQLPLDTATAQLKAELAANGVDWDQPLSAASFSEWHSRIGVEREAVDSAVKGLLRLTTTVASGNVLQESLTMRASDLHPVARTMSLRDGGTVEIAELEYEELPWSVVDSSIFEPIGGMSSERIETMPRVHPSLPSSAFALDEGELDEAELGAMLALRQLHADSDGRIQIARKANGIQVKGIVENEARKREVEAGLNMVSHVMPFIFTFQELQNRQNPDSQITSIGTASGVSEPSPLEKYMLAKGLSRGDVSVYSRQFSESSSEIRRDSVVISDLLKRFTTDQQLTPSARTMLGQLLTQCTANITAALDEETRALAQAGLASGVSSAQTPGIDLPAAAEQNRRLCEELISSGSAQSRSAPQILSDLLQAINGVRSASRHAAVADATQLLQSEKR
jgi:RNA polymerase sigma factor (sigma-70 family)